MWRITWHLQKNRFIRPSLVRDQNLRWLLHWVGDRLPKTGRSHLSWDEYEWRSPLFLRRFNDFHYQHYINILLSASRLRTGAVRYSMSWSSFWQTWPDSMGGCNNLSKVTILHFLKLFEDVDKYNTISSVFWSYFDSIPPTVAGVFEIDTFTFLNRRFWGGLHCRYRAATFFVDLFGSKKLNILSQDAQSIM